MLRFFWDAAAALPRLEKKHSLMVAFWMEFGEVTEVL